MSTHASHTIHLNLSLESAWKFLSDLSLAPYYVPGLTGCWFHPGPQSGRGASRRVRKQVLAPLGREGQNRRES